MVNPVSEQEFQDILEKKIGFLYVQALQVFRLYGPDASNDVLALLLLAIEQGKAANIVELLKEHWDTHLVDLHSDIRRELNGAMDSETHAFFMRLYEEWLAVSPPTELSA